MKVNAHNYKEFAIDYMVGNLSDEEAEAFTAFLTKHPDIADEFLLFETHDAPESVSSFSANSLKKEIGQQIITPDNFEEYCIASHEGDLDKHAEAELQDYISKSADHQRVYQQYAQCRLYPDTIAYPNKEALKQKVRPSIFLRRYLSIASGFAAAAVIFLFFLMSPGDVVETPDLAENKTNIETTTPVQETKAEPATTMENKALAQVEKPKVVKPLPKNPRKENITKPDTFTGHETLEVKAQSSLAKLQSKEANIKTNDIKIDHLALATSNYETPVNDSETEERTLTAQINNFLYTEVFARSVEGINRMAETDLGYDVIEDENGNPVKVVIRSRFGEINRTLAQR